METKNITQLKQLAAMCQVFMPDGTPAPFVMTPAEAIKFLRLDHTNTKHPEKALTYYHDKGLLKATYIGKCRFYTIGELCDFVEKVTRQNRKTKP